MESWVDTQLALLRSRYAGKWDIWFVPKGPAQGYWWCAKPAGTATATINAGSPEELVKMIGEQEAAP
jgi:hypothetical protein